MQEKYQLTYIQGIRGISIFLIVLFHLLPSMCPNGYMGVDVFFVIAGYFLLGKQVRKEHDFRLLPFLMQKGQRLLFPYFVLIFLVAIAAVIIQPAGDMMKAGQLLKACLMGKGNVFLDHLSGNYFSSDTRALPLMHLWYMGVMLQSLLLFAVLFSLWQRYQVSRKVRMVHLAVVGLLSFTVAFLYLLPLPFEYSQNTYYWTSARLWEFALGGLLYGRTRFETSACAPLLSAAAFIIITTCSFIPLPNSAAGVILGAFCGILFLLSGKRGWTLIPLENRFFVWMGNLSFSLYLVHWPCICYAEYVLGRALTCYDAAWLVTIILPTAYLFHRIIEKPRYSFAMLPIAALVAGTTYIGISITHGFKLYLHRNVNQVLSCCSGECTLPKLPLQSTLWNETQGIMSNQFSPHSAPEFLLYELGNLNQEISFVIIGDSHAYDLACGMHLCGKEHGWHGIFLNSYIVPFWGADFRTPLSIAPGNFFDEKKANRVINWLNQHPEIKTIFIAQYWSARMVPHQMWDGYHVEEDIIPSRAAELREFCKRVNRCDKTIVLVTDNPRLSTATPLRNLGSHLMWHQRKPMPTSLQCNRGDYEKLNGAFNEEMAKMEDEGICHVLHREYAFFTSDTFCAYNGEILTHRDNAHLTPAGAVFSISRLIPDIQQHLTTDSGTTNTTEAKAPTNSFRDL